MAFKLLLLSFFHETAFTRLVSLFREQLRLSTVHTWSADIPKRVSLYQFSLEPSAAFCRILCSGKVGVCDFAGLEALLCLTSQHGGSRLAQTEQGCQRAICGAHWVWTCLFSWPGYDERAEEAKHVMTSLLGLMVSKSHTTVSFSFYEGHFKSASQIVD